MTEPEPAPSRPDPSRPDPQRPDPLRSDLPRIVSGDGDGAPQGAGPADAVQMAEFIVHLGRAARGEDGGTCPGPQLTPAQWTALRFFDKANRASRTPSAFAEFHATTRGTASQTIKTLVSRGLLERHRAEHDGRSVCFELTEAGRALLEHDPLRHLSRAIARLAPDSRAMLGRILPDLVTTLARERGAQAFGTCDSCHHYQERGEGGYCACVAMSLAPVEIGQLCMRFVPRPEDAAAAAPATAAPPRSSRP